MKWPLNSISARDLRRSVVSEKLQCMSTSLNLFRGSQRGFCGLGPKDIGRSVNELSLIGKFICDSQKVFSETYWVLIELLTPPCPKKGWKQ